MINYIYLYPVKDAIKLIRSNTINAVCKSKISKSEVYLYRGEKYIKIPKWLEEVIHKNGSRENSPMIVLDATAKGDLIDTGLKFNQKPKQINIEDLVPNDKYEFDISEEYNTIVYEDENGNTYQYETKLGDINKVKSDLIKEGYKIISTFSENIEYKI